MSGEDIQIRVSFPESPVVFIQSLFCLFSDLRSGSRIIPVADLYYKLMKGLLLLAGSYLLVVIINTPVGTCLLGVIPFQSFIKQLVIDLLDWLVTVFYIEVGTLRVNIRCLEFAAVMVYGAFPDLCADCSFRIKSHPFLSLRQQRPLLLSAKVK